MFVGYAENHKGGVYRMWNPKTRKIYITRDVIFLNECYFKQQWKKSLWYPASRKTLPLSTPGRVQMKRSLLTPKEMIHLPGGDNAVGG
jgi:hypothetical protein